MIVKKSTKESSYIDINVIENADKSDLESSKNDVKFEQFNNADESSSQDRKVKLRISNEVVIPIVYDVINTVEEAFNRTDPSETIIETGNGHLETIIETGNGHLETIIETGNGHLETIIETGNGHLETIFETGNGHLERIDETVNDHLETIIEMSDENEKEACVSNHEV